MKNVISIRLDEDLDNLLSQVSQSLNRSRSEVVRDSLRRQLSIHIFDKLRNESLPYAEREGYLTDEDIFREIS